MSTEHLPTVAPTTPPSVNDRVGSLLDAWLSGRSAATTRAYAGDLADYAAWSGIVDVGGAAAALLAGGHGPANELALRYRNAMMERHLSAATVNRRLAALRSLVQLANTLGLVPWELVVPGVKSQPLRDTRGPGRAGVRKVLSAAESRHDAKGARDAAIVRLLYDLGLRRIEVCRLNLGDLDVEAGRLAVLGKGKREKQLLTLPTKTADALLAWVRARPATADTDLASPLFVNLDRTRRCGRLTGTGLYLAVRYLGEGCKVRVRPHAVRHSAITDVLTAAKGDVREARKFSRHSDVRTLMIYDDQRTDGGFELARKISDNL